MNLDELKEYLSSHGDSVTLAATDERLPGPLRSFLRTMPNQQVSVETGPDGITLVDSVLTIAGASTDRWPVQGMGDLVATLRSITITVEGAELSLIGAQARADLPLSTTVSAPVTITALQAEANPWQIKLEAATGGITPTQLLLLGWGGGRPAPFDIPPDLDVLSQLLTVEPDRFQISFYPNTEYNATCTFRLSAPQARWTLIEGALALSGIDLDAYITTTSVTGTLVGHFAVGGVGVDLGVSLDRGEDWEAFLRPSNGETFPGLADLVAWIGGEGNSFSEQVRAGFADLSFDRHLFDLGIKSVVLGFNWKKLQLNYLHINSRLKVGALPLQVQLRLPEVAISGSLDQADPVKVRAMLAEFGLATESVPENLAIAAVAFEADVYNGFYSAGVEVEQIWALGPVNLEEVGAFVSYGVDGGFSGQLEGRLALGESLAVEMAAGYDQAIGWHFEGGLAEESELSIGAVLEELGAKFGIETVPEPIRTLKLTELQVAFETGTGKFTFALGGEFTVVDTPVQLLATITVQKSSPGDESKPDTVKGKKGYSATFGGQMVIGEHQFNLIFQTQTGRNLFVAAYSHQAEEGGVVLRDLVLHISESVGKLIPAGITLDLRDVKFIFLAETGSKQFAFGLDIGTSISLADLPLVGSKLPPQLNLGITGLQVTYSSKALKEEQAGVINALLPEKVHPLPAAGLSKGISLAAEFQFGTNTEPLDMGVPESPAAEPGQPEPAMPPSTAIWIDVQKQFGIFQFKRIGVDYQENILFFLLDAGMMAGPLSLSLDGLAIGSPLTHFQPAFNLDGLGIMFSQGSLEIMGALLKLPKNQLAPETKFQFSGMLSVRAGQYALGAIGSFAQFKSGDPSLFIFGSLEAPLGGHPAFFVQGFMGGFGFNRDLQMPLLDEVAGFPLMALSRSGPGASKDPMHVLDVLEGRAPVVEGRKARQWIKPKPGSFWLAAGIQLSHFQILRTKALLIGLFSADEVAFGLLGSATMALPPASGNTTFAFVELQIAAVLKPMEGFVGLSGVLTEASYILVPGCRLTGGFALFFWFGKSEHAGDFVLTLGGYHPALPVPAHFPQVPRLGFNWAVSDLVTVKGGVYFALTTACAMAGGSLEMLFHMGGLQAWFTAHVDLLMAWHPFLYRAEIGVNVGVSYAMGGSGCQKGLSVSVGAKMELWGPPTGGKVHVDLWVASFTATFGAPGSKQSDDPLTWEQFKPMLPPPADVCKITVSSGLAKTIEQKKESKEEVWVVRSGDFRFTTQSAIPASHLRYGDTPVEEANPIAIRPMNQRAVTSVHQLRIYREGEAKPIDPAGWSLSPVRQQMPASLWSKPPEQFTQFPARPTTDLVRDQLVGYEVEAPTPVLGPSRGMIGLPAVAKESLPASQMPLRPGAAPSTAYVPTPSRETIGQIAGIMEPNVRAQRDALFGALHRSGLYTGPNGALSALATQAEQSYTDSPLQQS